MQRYRCVRCNKTFSEEQPLGGLRIDHKKAVQIVKLLCEGLGVRATARLVGCQKHTVLSVLETVGEKCGRLHDRLSRNLKVGSLQIDELWSHVGISQKRTTPDDELRGDFYTYLAVTAREKFIVSYHTGKRDFENTDTFVADVARRIAGRIQVTTDSYRPYRSLVRKHLLERLDYATMQKLYATPFDLPEAIRRYSPQRCIGCKIRTLAGEPRPDRISTTFVERANLSVRHFNKRFARLGLGWSRKLDNHKNALHLFIAAYNFCKVHSTLGTTPAHGIGLTTEPWTIEKLIEEATI